MVLTNASTAPMLMPTSFSGIEISQTTGQTISASSARGQHSTNRMHQPIRKSSVFTDL